MEGVEIEVLSEISGESKVRGEIINGSIVPLTDNDKKRDITEELCTLLLNRFEDAKKLNIKFMESNLGTKDKLNEIISLKTSMLVPSMRMALGGEFNVLEMKGAQEVIELLDSIEKSIYSLAKYEESENVDFRHPKIILGFKFLIEVLFDVLKEVVKDDIVIGDIAERVSMRTVGFEEELNKRLRSVANKALDIVKNPFSEDFLNREINFKIVSERIEYDLRLLERIKNSSNQRLSSLEKSSIEDSIRDIREGLNSIKDVFIVDNEE